MARVTTLEDEERETFRRRTIWTTIVLLFILLSMVWVFARNINMNMANMCRQIAVTQDQQAYCARMWSDGYG